MAAKKRGLGARDLDALLGVPESTEPTDTDELRTLDVTLIQPGKYQPRQTMDDESSPPDRLKTTAVLLRRQLDTAWLNSSLNRSM